MTQLLKPLYAAAAALWLAACCLLTLPSQVLGYGGPVPPPPASDEMNFRAYRTMTAANSILVIPVTFSGGAANPLTQADGLTAINEMHTWLQGASFGNCGLGSTKTVTTVVALPGSKAFYAANDLDILLTAAGDAAVATNAAWDIDNYDFYVVISESGAQGGSGVAFQGSNGMWLGNSAAEPFPKSTFAHELGHNLGLNHAGLWEIPSGTNPIVSTGTFEPYGSVFDVVGFAGYPRHYSAHYKSLLGWIPAANVAVIDSTTTTNVRIYAHDGGSMNPARNYAIRIPASVSDVASPGNRDIWLETRTIFHPNVTTQNGLIVQWGDQSGSPEGSCLIDTTPNTLNDFFDSILPVGTTMADPWQAAAGTNRITVTPVASGGTGADKYVDVAITTPNADLSALTFSAGTLSSALSNSVLNYSVSAIGATTTTVTATRADAGATLELRVNGGAFTSLTSGVASSQQTLLAGPNAVDVRVTKGGWRKTYNVNVLTMAQFPAVAGSLGNIPDGGVKDITFNVSGLGGNVTTAQVDFTFSPVHPFSRDIRIELINPNNIVHRVLEWPNQYGGRSLAGPYRFSDIAAGVFTATLASPMPAGNYRTQNGTDTATNMNAAFNLSPANGTWTLRFTDFSANTAVGGIGAANLYLATAAPAVPEIALEQPAGTNLNSGATVAYGTQTVGVASAAKTFTIKNTGAGPLTISSVSVTGGNAGDFTVNNTSMATSVPATTGSTTFTVTFNPAAVGARSTTLRIANNDSDEGTFDLILTGTGVSLPTVTTADPASVAATSASLGGNVTSAGGGTVSDRGIVWNTTGIPTIASNKVANGSGTGSFTATVSSLPSGTLIYVRAYATNGVGTAYGSEKDFTTTSAGGPGTIVWGPTQNWTGAATQVLTNGARHAAVCFVPSNAANPVVNGLTFDRPAAASPAISSTTATTINFVNASPISVSSWWYAATTAPVSGSGDFVTLVNHASFHQMTPGSITIGSLVVGQSYQVQIFMPYWEPQWPTTFSSASGAIVTLSGGRASGSPAAQYATGTFTAAATSHVVNFSAAAPGPWAGVSAISVRRTSLSTNADLSALTTTAGTLSFAANTTTYTASVPNATNSVTVTPTVAQAGATVKVNTVSVSSGAASGPISLNVGANTITTVVTAEDGTTTKTYTLTVTRAAPALTGIAITPTSVITTSQWINPDAGVRGKMIDGSGLSGSGSVFDQTHDQLSTAETMWHAGPDGGGISGGTTGNPPTVASQAVEFDLGANYNLTGAHIWNMNQQNVIGRGVKDVQILVSSATTGTFTPLITTIFTQGTGNAGLAAQVVPFTGATNVRRVRFAIQTAWSGLAEEYVGLSEVRFQGTASATAPGAPTIGTATAGNASASVAFTAPASNGGSPITSYTVTSSPGGITATGAASPISVPGLTNGTAYTFTVRATNAVGTSTPSTASNSVTPATVPGAPVIGTATAGNASASVAFTPPASNGGSAITGYVVTSSPGGITATGNSPVTVNGLTNGTPYTFTVTAFNAVGAGAASASSNSVTPVAPSTGVEVAGSNLPLPIPDNTLVGADVLFPVSGRTGTVTALSVQFTLNPAHTYASDLSVQLIAPDNTMTPIFNIGVDDDSNLGGPYTFQDSAPGYLSTAASFVGPLAVAASGTYRAENSGNQILLNTVFANKAPNGTWRLRFIDLSGTDTGTVSQASLTLTTSNSVYVAGSAGQFGYFDLTTRAYTQVSSNSLAGQIVTGLAYDSATNTMYLNDWNGANNTTSTRLRTIDRVTGVSTVVGTYNYGVSSSTIGLAFSPSGNLYNYGFQQDDFFSINPNTAASTKVGEPGIVAFATSPISYLGKLAFAGPNLYCSMWTSTGGALYSVNTSTGAFTSIGNGGVSATYQKLILFGQGDTLYGIEGSTLYSVNTTNGSLTSLGTISGTSLPAQMTAAVAVSAVVPTTPVANATLTRLPNGHVQVTLTKGPANTLMRLRRSTDLATWTTIGANVTTAANGTATQTDPAPPATRAFYRYEVAP